VSTTHGRAPDLASAAQRSLEDPYRFFEHGEHRRDAFAVPSDNEKKERYATRMDVSAALDTSRRNPEQGYYVDPLLTPTGADPKHEALKRAADLSRSNDFQKKRAAFTNGKKTKSSRRRFRRSAPSRSSRRT
jgi:hypothetical protein